MKFLALIPVVALMATGQVSANAESRRHHNRQVARIAESIEKREIAEAMEAMQKRVEEDIARPRALAAKPKRSVVRRGASGCRPKGSSFTPSSSATSTSTSSAALTSTSSAASTATSTAVSTTTSDAAATSGVGGNYNANYQVQSSPSSTQSATAASTPSSGGQTNSGSNSGQLTPNGKKAGLSAGDALAAMGDHIGWWYNWAPTDEGTSSSSVQFVPMLWGNGQADSTDASRLSDFESLSYTPTWIIGPEEPDCASGSGSSGMSISATASLWNWLMAPKKNAGSLLLSPSMCHQMAEDGWLGTFASQISKPWDITNVHINKNNMDGVKADLDYFWNTYGKPIWVTEFACVDDSTGFNPCTDQGEIDSFINDIVDLFESDSRVYAYAYSNGAGLGDVWPMWNGGMTASGQTYLNAVSKYH